MARTARLLYDNLALNASLSASSADFGYAVTNLKSPARWKKWRSLAATTDQSIVVDFGVATNFQSVMLASYVAHTGGAIRIQANATNSWGAPSVNVLLTLPSINPNKVVGNWFSSVQSYRYVRILFVNTGAIAQKVELGVLSIGTYFQPTYSLAPKYEMTRVDPSDVNRVPGGQRVAQRKTPYWQLRGGFDVEPETDRASFVAVSEKVGTHTPFFFAINPDDPGYFVLYGRFENGLQFGHLTTYHFGMPFTFSEDV